MPQLEVVAPEQLVMKGAPFPEHENRTQGEREIHEDREIQEHREIQEDRDSYQGTALAVLYPCLFIGSFRGWRDAKLTAKT